MIRQQRCVEGQGTDHWHQTSMTRGSFCYIRDNDSGRLWSTTYHPVDGKLEGYSVDFSDIQAFG